MTPESWLKIIQDAKKTAIIQDGKKKVHFLLKNGKEMVEEYNLDTNIVVRRAWKEKIINIGQDVGWSIEIGDSGPRPNNIEMYGIEENSSAPFITRRITKRSLEWRIRNLPYPKDIYSVTAEQDTITVRTSNRKYFKKIKVPDLERIGLKPEQDRLSFTHQFQTLIITYTKPPMLLDVEKKILNEVSKLDTESEGNVQCPVN